MTPQDIKAVRQQLDWDALPYGGDLLGELQLAERVPELAEPDAIAEVVLFLALDRAAVITGQVLHANSGGIMS